jgi:hypothetical protein
MSSDVVFDFDRAKRIGLAEAVLCGGKSTFQIDAILDLARSRDMSLLLTRLSPQKAERIAPANRALLDYCAISRTGFFGALRSPVDTQSVAIVAAGTSDAPIAHEAARTLRHAGVEAKLILDVGVAGLWRLMERRDEIAECPIVIAVAGMDAALASVLGGLVGSAVICVPTSVGYGAAQEGHTALNAMLASCASGLAVCNIDNGYGAACVALRIMANARRIAHP